MANYTSNFNLMKPLGSENYNVSQQNGNMDKIDASLQGLGNGLGIIANGNTHAAITSGEYVYVHGHGTLAEGLYKATANIAANGTLTSSNLSALPKGVGGDVSALNSKITNPEDPLFGHIKNEVTDANNFKAGWTYALSSASNLPSTANYFVLTFINDNVGAQVAIRRNNGGYMYFRKKNDGVWDSWYQVNATVVS